MTFVYLDLETTGLDPFRHEIWEVAWAVDDGPIFSGVVPHSVITSDPAAHAINGYEDRAYAGGLDLNQMQWKERHLREALEGATIVGANPAFDAAFLRQRWGGYTNWHHRLLDVEAYAMGALGHDKPQGLATIAKELQERGYDIPEPDHTAAGDVAAVRACHLALRQIYKAMRHINRSAGEAS